MRVKPIWLAACLIAIQSSFSGWAETLDVDYASFFSHVKKLDKEDTNKLRFAFGFMHIHKNELCDIKQAKIVTQKQTLPLTIENRTRFTVPTDKVLKMAKAKISIELNDNANQCDMSVQLETHPEYLTTKYTYVELRDLLKQYQSFFSNMGGFLSFMMPSAEGLVMHFNKNLVLPNNLPNVSNVDNTVSLDKKWFDSQNAETELELPQVPKRITALTVK